MIFLAPLLARLGGLWAKAIAAVAIVLGILITAATLFRKAEKAGEDKVHAADAQATIKAVEERKQTDATVDSMSDDAVAGELRDKWTKH